MKKVFKQLLALSACLLMLASFVGCASQKEEMHSEETMEMEAAPDAEMAPEGEMATEEGM